MLPNSNQIPNFITAGSPLGLRRQMLKNNVRLGAFVRYFDITYVTEEKKSYWVAWFYEDVTFNDAVIKSQGAKNGAAG